MSVAGVSGSGSAVEATAPGVLGRLGFRAWTTRDLVTVALLIAIGGVFKGYWGGVRLALEASLGPLVTGWIVGAGFSLFGVLPLLIIPKTGVATLSMVIGSAIELAVGNPFGVEVFVLNFWEGLGPDIVFALFCLANGGRIPRLGWRFAVLAGIASTSLGTPYTLVTRGLASLMQGFTPYGSVAVLLLIANRVLGGIIAGAVSLGIATSLKKMGVLGETEGYRVVDARPEP
jgi:ABC-type thiamin/hydroxymethylpyrimidine transport system permease subunit